MIVIFNHLRSLILLFQVYSKVSGEPPLDVPTVDVSSKEFYGEGYDDSDKRIPDMTIINRQLGILPRFSAPTSLPCLGLLNVIFTCSPSLPLIVAVYSRLESQDISLGLT